MAVPNQVAIAAALRQIAELEQRVTALEQRLIETLKSEDDMRVDIVNDTRMAPKIGYTDDITNGFNEVTLE